MTQQEWSQEQAATVGAEIRRLREQAPKRSAQWLSDRTEELGYLVSRSTIADLEIGRRKHVLVSELLVLAAALKVPPVALLYPDLPDGLVEALPGAEMTSIDAVQWFSGEDVAIESTSSEKNIQRVKTARALKEAREELASAEQAVSRTKNPVTDEDVQHAQTAVRRARKRRDLFADILRSLGGTVNDG